jgi:cytoskeleton-associated protein 5
VDSTNSKTRAASLEMLSHLIRKRGDIAPSASSVKLYRRIAEQISSPDSNTRNHALDCIAYLHKYSGNSAFNYTQDLSQKERDLLQNRIDKLAGSRSSGPSSVSSPPQELESSTATSDASDILRHGSTTSARGASEAVIDPMVPREEGSLPASSSSMSTQDSIEGPPPYSRPRTNFEIRARAVRHQVLSSRTAIPHPSAPAVHASASPFRRPPSPTIHPSARARQLAPPPAYEQTRAQDLVCETAEDVEQRIRQANTSDAKVCVDCLKALQAQLIAKPHLFADHVPLLLSTVTRQFERLFEKEGRIDQDGMFRMAKHLIQTMSNFCDLPELLAKVTADILQDLLEQLTLGLLILTDDTHKEMARFVNMTILRLFAANDQVVLFR